MKCRQFLDGSRVCSPSSEARSHSLQASIEADLLAAEGKNMKLEADLSELAKLSQEVSALFMEFTQKRVENVSSFKDPNFQRQCDCFVHT